jgi:hypothetical protein
LLVVTLMLFSLSRADVAIVSDCSIWA